MSTDHKDFVTTGTCKIVTDALNEKIAAQKLLVDAEIKGIRSTIYATMTTATLILVAVEILLRVWRP